MYSSVYGGIILDPAMMVIPIDDHMVHRGQVSSTLPLYLMGRSWGRRGRTKMRSLKATSLQRRLPKLITTPTPSLYRRSSDAGSSSESGQTNGGSDPAAAIRNGKEIILQAFNWESHKHDWWKNLDQKVPDIAKSGFTSAWLPPPTHSIAPEGYFPQNIYSLSSSYGSEHQLKALLKKMKTYKVRAMADIVINHRPGTT